MKNDLKAASKYFIRKTTKDKSTNSSKNLYVMILFIIIFVIVFILSFTVGSYHVSTSEIINIFYAKLTGSFSTLYGSNVENVIFKIRMPRIFAAVMIGAALSVAGSAYQGLFRNPMVSSDILGASGGAGLGAAIGLLLSFNSVQVQSTSFILGLIAVLLTYSISSVINRGEGSILSLILTGMVVANICSAFISIIKYVGDPDNKLPEITFWLMGGLSTVTVRDVLIMIIPMIVGFVPLFILRWKLNVLSFGDEEASSLGVNVKGMRAIVIVCSTLITSVSVSVGGMIGWVGLIIPHLARMIVGPNYKVALPASMIIGSIYLLIVDDVARSLFTMEIPLGILTSLIGAPFFIYLLLKGRRGWI